MKSLGSCVNTAKQKNCRNELPEKYKKKFSQILGKKIVLLEKQFSKKTVKGIWINTNKTSVKEFMKKTSFKKWKTKQLKLHSNALQVIKEAVRIGQTKEFKKGFFNLQDIAGMLPALILSPEKNSEVLDCCAAPGTKTIQLSNLLQGTGKIIAVEKNKKRFKSLVYNIKKFELKNVVALNTNFFGLKKKFGFVLLDAPCSSSGLAFKKKQVFKNWSPSLVKRRSKTQKKMILKAFDLLKPNGVMVYSVCTLCPEECESVILKLLKKKANTEIIKPKINGLKHSCGIKKYREEDYSAFYKKCVRIWPWQNNTQGFFIAKIKKKQKMH